MSSAPPILEASSLRVDVGGSPAVDDLTLASTADRVLVIGAPRALFEAAAGMRVPRRGELRVAGAAPADAVRAGAVAGAPADPPLPPKWTVAEYVAWSARLAGHGRATAAALAGEALGRLELASFAGTRLGVASIAARRGAVVAAAIATGAATILLEDPLPGIPADTARAFGRLVVRALADRRTALFAARVPLDSPVGLAADEAIVLSGSQVTAQGAPAEIAAREGTFVVRVGGDVAAFVDAVRAEGGTWHAAPATAWAMRAPMTVDLGDLKTADLLRLAAGTNAVVLELRPVSAAFA